MHFEKSFYYTQFERLQEEKKIKNIDKSLKQQVLTIYAPFIVHLFRQVFNTMNHILVYSKVLYYTIYFC